MADYLLRCSFGLLSALHGVPDAEVLPTLAELAATVTDRHTRIAHATGRWIRGVAEPPAGAGTVAQLVHGAESALGFAPLAPTGSRYARVPIPLTDAEAASAASTGDRLIRAFVGFDPAPPDARVLRMIRMPRATLEMFDATGDRDAAIRASLIDATRNRTDKTFILLPAEYAAALALLSTEATDVETWLSGVGLGVISAEPMKQPLKQAFVNLRRTVSSETFARQIMRAVEVTAERVDARTLSRIAAGTRRRLDPGDPPDGATALERAAWYGRGMRLRHRR